jgi:hypothetical protein
MAIYLILILIGTIALLVGVLALRVSKKMQKLSNKVTYGEGVDKHMLQTGITIEHGMVIGASGKLQAQSKTSDAKLESMLIK